MTALSISGMTMIGVYFVFFVGDLIVGLVGSDNIWFTCCTVSDNISFDKFVDARCVLPWNVVCWVLLLWLVLDSISDVNLGS
jgi:hypothetical protein